MGIKSELRTYHYGLKYLFDQGNLNARKARWLEFLCELDFEIKHIKGKENALAPPSIWICYVSDLELLSMVYRDIKHILNCGIM